jgi:hypothetical protein
LPFRQLSTTPYQLTPIHVPARGQGMSYWITLQRGFEVLHSVRKSG